MDARSRRDDKKWRQFLRDRLSPAEREALEESWQRTMEYRRVMSQRLDRRERELAKRAWMSYVLSLDVQLKPGRAIIRESGDTSGSRVEFRWVGTSGVRPMGGRAPSVEIAEIRIFFGAPGYGMDPGLDDYRAALAVRFASAIPESFRGGIPWRPAPGQPPNLRFYRWLLASFDALAADGHRAPAVELARLLDAEHETVKTWLRRGRRYLREGAA
jgi:hypothetical protein